jgi:mRNA-degrading endonuclease YafQ of YafQ-DinJ toxin-antitoxin module
VKHVLLRSTAFVRDSRRMLRKRPDLVEQLLQALRLLEADPYAPRLKTHKLKGKHHDSWACSGGYDLRVVFSFTQYGGKAAILLMTVGTHDEVY